MRANDFVEMLSHRHKYAAPALLLLVTLITYFQVTGHDFISYDDTDYITGNAHVMNGLSYEGVKWAVTSLEISYWHPMTWVSHMVDYQLYGKNPAGHHLTSLIIHLLNTLLLFYLLLYSTRQYWPSLFVAGLFALHPLHVESVAWAAERKDVLSTFFMMLTLFFYSAFIIEKKRKFYFLAIFFYVLGLMSKPMLVSLPLVLMLWDYWPLDRYRMHDARNIDLMRDKVPFFVLAVLTSLITYYAQLKVGTVMSVDSAPLLLRILNAFSSYMNYIYKMFWPQNLAVIYPLSHKIPVMQGIISGLLLLGISAIVFRYRKSHRYLTTGWSWYLITLLPVIGIVQVGLQAMADRYTYTTQIGLYIMIAWGTADWLEKYRYKHAMGFPTGIILISALTVCTWTQLTYWKDSITLFNHAAHSVANNNIAYRILGNNYAKSGNVPAAIASLSEALDIEPDDPVAHVDLGVALVEQKRYEDAMYHYKRAIALDPRNDNAHYNLGVLLAYSNRFEEAIDSYGRALILNPGRKGAHANIGAALLHLGRFDEAIMQLQEELILDPGNQAVRNYLTAAMDMKEDRKRKF